MNYRQLGTSALHISEIGFGCMSLQESAPDPTQILHRALDQGINFFDTADLYDKGGNETIVGRAFHDRRHEVILATKVGNQWRPDGSGWLWNPRKDYILSAVEASLRRLQTDYIDLYQLHGGTIDDPIDETIAAFELLRLQGKIRYYGISSIRPNVIREYVRRSSITSVMMQYSLLDRRPEESCLPLLIEKNIGMLARGTLAQGLLVDKPAKAYLDHGEEAVGDAAGVLRGLSGPERDPAATAIRYVLEQPGVTAAVIGIRTMNQLDDALTAAAAPPLNRQELERLNKAIYALRYTEHR